MTEILEKVKRKMEQLNNRIEIRRGLNHYDESKRLMILEERLGVYEELLPDIASLITTIESLQAENTKLSKRLKSEELSVSQQIAAYSSLEKQVESQNEEIERLYDALLSIVDGNWSCLFYENGLEVWSTDRINPSGIAFQAISYKQDQNAQT